MEDCGASAERHLLRSSDALDVLAFGDVELVGIIGCLTAMVSNATGLSIARAVPAEAEVNKRSTKKASINCAISVTKISSDVHADQGAPTSQRLRICLRA